MKSWQNLALLGILLFLTIGSGVQAYTYTTYITNATHDGWVTQYGNLSWKNTRDGTGSSATNSPPSGDLQMGILANATSGYYNSSDRVILTFDTSYIPDDAIVISADVTVWGTAKANGVGGFNISLVDVTPGNRMLFSAGDFDATSFIRMSPDLEYSTWATDNINTFPLTAAGMGYINIMGDTSYMLTNNYTVDNVTPAWASDLESYARGAPLSSSSKPYMTIYYRTGTPISGTAMSTDSGGNNILAALNMAGLLIIVSGVCGLIYSLLGLGGFAGGSRGSYYSHGSSGLNTTLLISSITAILVGSVLLILTYTVLSALITASGI